MGGHLRVWRSNGTLPAPTHPLIYPERDLTSDDRLVGQLLYDRRLMDLRRAPA